MARKIFLAAFLLFAFFSVGCAGDKDNAETGAKKFPAFSARDLAGNMVTNDIFNEKITAVNLWTTDCDICREEMPALWSLADTLPDDTQLIGLAADLRDGDATKIALAKKIAANAPKSYKNLVATEDFDALLKDVTQVPTTFFVDDAGNIVGQPVVGGDAQWIRCELFRLRDENSPRTKNLRRIQDALFYDR